MDTEVNVRLGRPLAIGLLAWEEDDGIVKLLKHEFEEMGHVVHILLPEDDIPSATDLIVTHGPHGEILPYWQKCADYRAQSGRSLVTAHWNTEGLPDLRLPSRVVQSVGSVRSAIGRWKSEPNRMRNLLSRTSTMQLVQQRMNRFRYIGDYDYAIRNNLLDILADSSQVYVSRHRLRGIEALYVPWGATKAAYETLELERDIDVLWMGKRGSRRRSHALDYVCTRLKERGLSVYIADDIENPFIFNEERIDYLNRAKVTLNLTRTWYDDNYSRFSLAVPNRSLIVSEPLLPHCPEYEVNQHYIAAAVKHLPDTIQQYVEDGEARNRIVEQAFTMITERLSFQTGLQKITQRADILLSA